MTQKHPTHPGQPIEPDVDEPVPGEEGEPNPTGEPTSHQKQEQK
jgi:hypothetical protein